MIQLWTLSIVIMVGGVPGKTSENFVIKKPTVYLTRQACERARAPYKHANNVGEVRIGALCNRHEKPGYLA